MTKCLCIHIVSALAKLSLVNPNHMCVNSSECHMVHSCSALLSNFKNITYLKPVQVEDMGAGKF